MKTRVWQRFTAVTFLALAATISRGADGAEAAPAPPPDDAKATAAASDAPVPVAPVATNPVPGSASVIPPKLSLPPLLDQVVRLSKSGADEAVMKAYLEKSAPAYRVTGHDILALQEQGVPRNVILALLEHSRAVTPGPDAAVTPVAAPETSAIPTVTPPLTPDVEQFYDALAPYGNWIEVADYGWAWQPTVVVVNPAWRPYCDNGSWLWSDSGWYWNSSYSWGWAPFHYGRWFSHPQSGWLWCPDREWGPSWVCWRNSATHCGWAPLPPGACFRESVGWSHWGTRVDADCNFGLASAHFNFVAHDRFTDHHVGRHRLRGHDANTAFAHTKVINHYSVGENNRVFNHGVGREQIAAAQNRPIAQVTVSDAQPRRGSALGRTFAAGASPAAAASRVNNAHSGRNAVASIAPQNARNFSGHVAAGVRPSPNYSSANRSASAAPRVNNLARVNPQVQPRFSAPSTRSFQARPTVAPQRSIATARSYSAPATVQRNFSARPAAAAPSFRGGATSGGSVARGGGGMSVGRSATAGRR